MDIFIKNKKYSKVETLPISKLEHMRQLICVEIENYEKIIKNYPKERMERFGKPFLSQLQQRKETVEKLIKQKQNT